MALLNLSRTQVALIGVVFTTILVLLFAADHRRVPTAFHFPHSSGSNALLDEISNTTLGFEKILAIALPSRTDEIDALALSAAFSDLHVEIIDGVTEVSEKALPPDTAAAKHPKGVIGSWRAHMNALRYVVEHNISSALILEGDADWDLRIKSQMAAFASASKMLVQPVAGSHTAHIDPTWPRPKVGDTFQDFLLEDGRVREPTTSPYGDVKSWDVLWLGHCGMDFAAADGEMKQPLGRVIIPNDDTVAAPQQLRKEWGSDDFITQYKPHTRIVSHGRSGVCSIAYAVSQHGARKLLYETGLQSFSAAFDIELRRVCDGLSGHPGATCLTVQPPLFQSHLPVGPKSALSNIGDHEGYNDVAFTNNIRWSTRVNLPRLLADRTDYVDSWPDNGP